MNLILFEENELQRFSTPGGQLLVPLSDDRGQHMRNVLRLRSGDEVKVGTVGAGYYSKFRVEGFSDQTIALSPTAVRLASPPLFPVTMIVGQVRPICIRRILRDVAGLGIERLIIAGADNAERSYAEARVYKDGAYRRYLLDGGMQAGSTLLAEVLLAKDTDEALAMASGADLRVLLDNVIGNRPLSECDGVCRAAALAIGPERGWSERERALFVRKGYEPMRLGERVLRTETAVPAGGALLLSRLGFL